MTAARDLHMQIKKPVAKAPVEAGELVEVMPSYRTGPIPMTLLYPHRHHLSRRVHVFADWLENLLKREVQ